MVNLAIWTGARIVLSGILELAGKGDSFVAKAIVGTATFNALTLNDDPYGEHDFGGFELEGEPLFWKIDYCDKQLEYGSPDPSNQRVTTRVLTIMLASDY